jgi:medium-chain acyl-[acyl-carrier-protein] hydrolase
MEIQQVWTEEITIRFHETDFQQRWKPSSFLAAMQEASNKHADHLGWGHRDMLAKDMVWVIARMKIYFHRFPLEGDRVLVRTWPKGMQQKLFFMRDFHILTPQGETVARASSAYVLINPQTRRMQPPDKLVQMFPPLHEEGALNESLEKIPPAVNPGERLRVQAGYSVVDLLGHVNNAYYVNWISDCFSLEDYRDKKLEWLQINYSNEVKAFDQVSVSLAESSQPGVWIAVGDNLTSGARAFDAALKWNGAQGK